ncbi:MAG TPA: ATP-binding cassette domain-containing protein, partial [Tissierellaceae bacterium]|nr:ATP-binding cassette domain-containing protein [Tissierellaceae bacterium]
MIDYKKHAPHLLSGGQKQRVAIAGILAMRPDCVILDEPTSMLDPIGRIEVMETIEKLNKEEGKTIVLITHYMDEAVLGDRIIVLNKGEILMEGTPKDVFKQVDRIKEIGLDVPQVTELVYELRKEGIDIRDDVLSVEELLDIL